MEMVEGGIVPEFYIKVSINHQSTSMISNNLVNKFYWSILMRRISVSRMDFVSMLFKDIDNIRVRIKFAYLIHENILVFQIRAMDV